MAISWKEQSKTPAAPAPEPARFDAPALADIHPGGASVSTPTPIAAAPARAPERDVKESLIASDITIEGKIEGSGHVRIAGRFKGDVNVQGNLTIEVGAKLTGGVRAAKVIIAGELEGNIEAAQRVELLESGVLIGDVKAGTMTVAAGSRMRGQMDFGWEDKPGSKSSGNKTETGAES
jgi:cytoskeletal protein CcmA (bactofilin family)